MALDEDAERECIHEWLPHLEGVPFEVRSETDHGYNCVAWAAGDDTKIWSPAVGVKGKLLGGYYWPREVPKFPTVAATEAVFELKGFVRTSLDDTLPERDVEKVAIFGEDEMGLVTHAARQRPSGQWSSKMGDCGDIDHALRDIEGPFIGILRSVMRKDPVSSQAPRAEPRSLVVVERRARAGRRAAPEGSQGRANPAATAAALARHVNHRKNRRATRLRRRGERDAGERARDGDERSPAALDQDRDAVPRHVVLLLPGDESDALTYT